MYLNLETRRGNYPEPVLPGTYLYPKAGDEKCDIPGGGHGYNLKVARAIRPLVLLKTTRYISTM